MYYPYFRGKQYELITIRESANLIYSSNFVPIIEPVREQISGLRKALDTLQDEQADVIVIANPQYGDLSEDGSSLISLIQDDFNGYEKLTVGILLTEEMSTDEAIKKCKAQPPSRNIALVHSGFAHAKNLSQRLLDEELHITTNVFIEDYCGKLYRRHFKHHDNKVLLRDGCVKRKRNRDHPDLPEFFSDLHVTYEDENASGFGDFLIVGDEYLEGGGPAYTIAIHLTYIDQERDEEMLIQHFKSDRQDTPKDPAGKFAEALSKLDFAIEQEPSKFFDTSAIREFRALHERGHYPGLGYVKKLSMRHHIETLAIFLEESGGGE